MNTVLVVDDDKEIVDAIEIYLKKGLGLLKHMMAYKPFRH